MNFSFNLVVIPPELHTNEILKTYEELEAHLRLIGMTCWAPQGSRGFKTQWPWGIGGECECPDRNKEEIDERI